MGSTFQRRRWYKNIIFWMVVISIALMAGVSIYTFLAYRRTAVELLLERDHQLASLSAMRLNSEFANFSTLLQDVARINGIAQGDMHQQRFALQQAGSRVSVFDGGVILLDNQGVVQWSVPIRTEIMGQDWSGRDYFYQLLSPTNSVYYSDTTQDGPQNAPVIVFSVPIVNANGEFRGALAGMFRMGAPVISPFYATIVRLRIGQSGSTYLVDGQGKIIYASTPAQVGQTLNLKDLPLSVYSGKPGAVQTVDEEGNQIVAAYAPIPKTNWTLLIEEDWALLTRSTQFYANILLLSLILSLVLPTAGLLYLTVSDSRAKERQSREELSGLSASRIRQALLPQHTPLLPGWDITIYHDPLEQGGDEFYDLAVLPDGRLIVALGQSDGPNLPAAILSAATRTSLRSAASHLESSARVLQFCNDMLCQETTPDLCIRCIFAILDPDSGRLEYSNAGHHPFIVGNQQGIDELGEPDEPLGFRPDVQYRASETQLKPGDVIIFLGHGMANVRNLRGENFTLARLRTSLDRASLHVDELADLVKDELLLFFGNEEPKEDVTLIVLERLQPTPQAIS